MLKYEKIILCFSILLCIVLFIHGDNIKMKNDPENAINFVKSFLDKVNSKEKFSEQDDIFFFGEKYGDLGFALNYEYSQAFLGNLFIKNFKLFEYPQNQFDTISFVFANLQTSESYQIYNMKMRKILLPGCESVVVVSFRKTDANRSYFHDTVICFYLDKDKNKYTINMLLSTYGNQDLKKVLGIKNGEISGTLKLVE